MSMIVRQRAADYLWSQQGADGGWHSERYGALRSGAAVTALILRALSRVPSVATAAASRRTNAQAALDFLRRGVAKRGCVAAPDGTLDFPVYATALALLTEPVDWPTWSRDERRVLADYLSRAQWSEARGLAAFDPDRGGWDVAGSVVARGPSTGTNISIARHALQALARWRQPQLPGDWPEPWQTVRVRALDWLERCQNHAGDGGFFFSPTRAAADNKAGWRDDAHEQPRSYHSATYDGLLAYQAVGLDQRDSRMAAALQWVTRLEHDGPVEGLAAEWHESLRFYSWAAQRQALPLLGEAERVRRYEVMERALVGGQRADGSWQNSAVRMREDDSLIATALALVALEPLT